MKRATPEKWAKARELFSLKTESFHLDNSPDMILNEIITALEDTVKECFDKISIKASSKAKSKSLIPHEARTLMKQKLNASKALQSTDDTEKVNALKIKIAKIEDLLRIMVHKWRSDKEKKARSNLSHDPAALHGLVKALSRKSSKIGPLKRTTTTKDWTEAQILSKQYSDVFTVPAPENMFENVEEFFSEEHNDIKGTLVH